MDILKILAVTYFILFPAALMAQTGPDTIPSSGSISKGYIGNTNSSFVSFIDELKYDAGFHMGLSRSNLNIEPGSADTSTKAGTGVIVGGFLEIKYKSYISLEINYSYSKKVSKFQYNDQSENFYTGTFTNEYFSLPIFLKAKTDADLVTAGKPIEIYGKAGVEYNSLQHATLDVASSAFNNLAPPLMVEKFGNDITEYARSHEINLALSPGVKIHIGSSSYLNLEGRWIYPFEYFFATGQGEDRYREYSLSSFQLLFGIGTHLN